MSHSSASRGNEFTGGVNHEEISGVYQKQHGLHRIKRYLPASEI
jgi:hypothetical protein